MLYIWVLQAVYIWENANGLFLNHVKRGSFLPECDALFFIMLLSQEEYRECLQMSPEEIEQRKRVKEVEYKKEDIYRILAYTKHNGDLLKILKEVNVSYDDHFFWCQYDIHYRHQIERYIDHPSVEKIRFYKAWDKASRRLYFLAKKELVDLNPWGTTPIIPNGLIEAQMLSESIKEQIKLINFKPKTKKAC